MLNEYFMESEEEVKRLDLKTDEKGIIKQAQWAGIQPGMRVADLGCGPGKTTYFLHKLVQPGGEAVGVDISEKRLKFAREHYSGQGIEYVRLNICEPLDELGHFDFIWMRFFLEYHRSKSFDIIKNISCLLKPGGILCLIDLDYNCLTHFGLSHRLEKTITGIINILERDADFDPYVGRKLYSFLYDLGYKNIDVSLAPHHLIYGELKKNDAFNWMMKIEVAARKSGYGYEEYNGDYDKFLQECRIFLADPRRFVYTPVILCRGQKHVH